VRYDNQPDPNKPLKPGRRHIVVDLTCHEETIGANIRRGEIVSELKKRDMVTPKGTIITENAAYFWHPLSVCCSTGTITIDGQTTKVEALTLDDYIELPGAINAAWTKELEEANPDLFNYDVAEGKKNTLT
jgi:hypothetical protein